MSYCKNNDKISPSARNHIIFKSHFILFSALPTMAYKKSVTVSVSDESVAGARISEKSSHQYSCTRESTYLPSESKSSKICSNRSSGSIKQLVHSIGTDMRKSIAVSHIQ